VQYHRLTLGERYQIQALLARGVGVRGIALQLQRNASTISREVAGISIDYNAAKKHSQANRLRRLPHPELQVIRGDLEGYVHSKIMLDWSPEQISGRLYRERGKKIVSHQTIYRYIERDKTRRALLWRHLRILRKARKDRKQPQWRPHPEPHGKRFFIYERPSVVEKRERLGDFERDTLLGKRGGSFLLTLVDRASRYLKLAWLPFQSSEEIHQATVKLLKGELVHTITNDNSTEFAKHRKTAAALQAKVYFSRSYAAWERGTNENINGLLRQYFPRKKDIGYPSKLDIQRVLHRLNHRPKKCLGYQTPHEVHHQLKRQALQ